MEEKAKTKVQYQDLIEKAKELVNLNDAVNKFINQLREQLIQATGDLYTTEEALAMKNPALEGRPKGLTEVKIVEQILLESKDNEPLKLSQAQQLDQKIQALKKQYIALFEALWDIPILQPIIFPKMEEKAQGIRNLTKKIAFRSSLDYVTSNQQDKTWEAFTFGNRPLAAVLPILRNIQANIQQSEYAILAFFQQQFDAATSNVTYDTFEIIAQSAKPSIRLGETYEAAIGLGVYSSKAAFSVIIEGDTLSAINGKVTYRTRPKYIGQQYFTPKIRVSNPLTGEVEQFSKEFSFEVIQ